MQKLFNPLIPGGNENVTRTYTNEVLNVGLFKYA